MERLALFGSIVMGLLLVSFASGILFFVLGLKMFILAVRRKPVKYNPVTLLVLLL